MKVVSAVVVAIVVLGAGRPGTSPRLALIASDQVPTSFRDQALGTSRHVLVHLYDGSSGVRIFLPVVLVKGRNAGPTLVLTAAMHGDEVTGVPVVQRFVNGLDVDRLRGDVVAIPVVNPFGFARRQRGGFAGDDINRSFRAGAPVGERRHYAARLLDMLAALGPDCHVDLHTATSGNDNAFYVRADLGSPRIRDLARVMQPQLVLNTTRPDNSLRGAMEAAGVDSVALEMGGPVKVDARLERKGLEALSSLARHLRMIDDDHGVRGGPDPDPGPVICSASAWVCTPCSGLVFPQVGIMARVAAGAVVAEIRDLFGRPVRNVTAPHDGVVIGLIDRLPVEFGARIVHVGRIAS